MNTQSNLTITCETDCPDSGDHAFCHVEMRVNDRLIGDGAAWSVAGLMVGAISSLVDMLAQQKVLEEDLLTRLFEIDASDLFHALYSWQWEGARWAYEEKCALANSDVRIFNALPLGTEIFDGENAYLIFFRGEFSRFIWRDYESGIILEQLIDFDEYLMQWSKVRSLLEETKRS